MATEPRRGRRWARNLTLAGAALVPALGPPAHAQPPKPAAATAPAAPEKRVVAYIHGTTAVTREELGEFLIARGGMDKIDLVVNRRIIERAAAEKGVTVTPQEIEAGLNEDLAGIGANRREFVEAVLPKYKKTLYEWEQDVIRPRLLLGKMARPTLTATPEELQKAFETKYGEKRQARVIGWPKGDPEKVKPLSADVRALAQSKPEEFAKLATAPQQRFAASKGNIDPIGRHIEGEDPAVEAALFALKEGEISQWIETPTESVCIQCVKIIPPDPKITLESVRGEIERIVIDRKLGPAIPAYFASLREAAKPALTVHVPPRPPADPAAPVAPRVEHPDPRVLAVLHGNVTVTREDLGEFLIARGGFEKVELLVNKKIIEAAMAERGVTLTPEEVEAGRKAYVAKLPVPNLTVETFVKDVLPKERGVTEFVWTEDLIKPDLVLAKMCKDRVKVTPEDIQKAFENRYGEKRAAKIIIWGNGEGRVAQKQWAEARKGDAEFDRIARTQSNASLGSRAGEVEPIGRNLDAESPLVEKVVFTLQEGELSQLFQTPAGIMCVKCVKKLPPTPGVTLEMVRPALEKELFDRKLAKEIPAFFAELKQKANPTLLLKGPPTQREFEEGVRNMIQQAGGDAPKK